MSNSVAKAQASSSVPDWVLPVGVGVATIGGSLAVAYLADKYSRASDKPDTISLRPPVRGSGRPGPGSKSRPSGPTAPGPSNRRDAPVPRRADAAPLAHAWGRTPPTPVTETPVPLTPLGGAGDALPFFHQWGNFNPPANGDAFEELRRANNLRRVLEQRAARGADPRPVGGLHDDELDDLPADVLNIVAQNRGADLPENHPFRRAQQRRMNAHNWHQQLLQQQLDRARAGAAAIPAWRAPGLPPDGARFAAAQPPLNVRIVELPNAPEVRADAAPAVRAVAEPALPEQWQRGEWQPDMLDVHNAQRAAEAVINHGKITEYLRDRNLFNEAYDGHQLAAEKTKILAAIQTYRDQHVNDPDFAVFGAVPADLANFEAARPGGEVAIRNAMGGVEKMFDRSQQRPFGREFAHLPTRNFLIHAWKVTETMPDEAQKLLGQENIIRSLAEASGHCNTGHISRVLDATISSYPQHFQPALSQGQVNELVNRLYQDENLHPEFARIFHDGNAQDLQRFLENTMRERGHVVPSRHVEAIVQAIPDWQPMRDLFTR